MIWGTVFVMNTSGNNYQRLYSFGGKTNNGDGAKPIDNVILVNGMALWHDDRRRRSQPRNHFQGQSIPVEISSDSGTQANAAAPLK